MRRSGDPTRTRVGGGSLAVRVIAVAVVPLLAMGAFATDRIADQRARAGAASDLVGSIELQRALTAMYPPVQLERMALEIFAHIDARGLDRALVIGFAGIELESAYGQNADTLDEALEGMQTDLEGVDDEETERLDIEIGLIGQQLDFRRNQVGSPGVAISDPSEPFDRLEVVMADIVDLAKDDSNIDGVVVGNEAMQLAALGDVMVSAGAYGNAKLDHLLHLDSGEFLDAVVGSRAVHVATLDRFVTMLSGLQQERFEAARDQFAQMETITLPPAGTDPGIADLISLTSDRLLEHLDYIDLLQSRSDAFGAEALDQVSARAAAAEADVLRTQVVVAVIVVLSALLIGLLLWAMLRPLRRLARQAELISAGELALSPVPVSGARDLRALAITTNEMLLTLRGVEHQINDLADGVTCTSQSSVLPGAIGVALRRSVDRLADTTTQLHASEQLASAIVEQAADAIWTIDGSGTIRSANDASAELTGVACTHQIGRPLDEYLSALDGEMHVIGAPTPTKVLVAHSVIDAGDTDLIAVIARDISERAHFEERLAFQARHDALTSMPNRLAVLEHLDLVFRGSDGPVAVLFVDIDGFKSINDTHGHVKGDWVLTEIAKRLSSSVRSDEFVARLGGDEFVVVTGVDDLDALVKFGERLIRHIEQPYFDGENMFALSASVGVASATGERSALEALRKADSACYSAKRRGRGRVEIFDAELQATIAQEADLALALRRSVPNNELILHLQPIVDLRTGRLFGAEALVRWDRPGVGLVPPGDFIPIAERSSLIFDIERWVLKTSCEHVVEWRRHDPTCELRIAVNVSGRHMIEGHLVKDLCDAIEATGADPTMLEFELTETQLLEDLDRASEVLDAIRALGVTIAVDDFGTGYSSMTYLRHLPIDSIKIDQSFVARATEGGFDSTVVESLLAIGRTLHLDVVAEGVETELQLDYVRDRGCDRAQGYLLARPMAAELFDAELRAGQWIVASSRPLNGTNVATTVN